MKKQQIKQFILLGFFFCVLVAGYVAFYNATNVVSKERMQSELAMKLGVRIEDYPYRTSFPAGYFYTVLQPGMTLEEVHQKVQGYEKVLHCGSRSEIYYFFSSELEDAKRFKLRYDEHGKYLNFEGEEDDSRTLQINGCELGTITK